MLRKISIVLASLSLLVWVSPSSATKPAALELPEQASQVAENVYYLGTAQDSTTGKVVEGYAIVHRKPTAAKPNAVGGPKGGSTTCYGFIVKGAMWRTTENWVMNPANPDGLNGTTLFGLVDGSISKWETAASNANIMGSGSQTGADLSAGYGTKNDVNEVYFGSLPSGTIAVTTVWGYFSGPTFAREIIEWDQVYNTYYDWSAQASGVANKMDFDNIATHELGHSFGMGDIYNSSCSTVTMYGYADYADINKRSLESADVTGINALY